MNVTEIFDAAIELAKDASENVRDCPCAPSTCCVQSGLETLAELCGMLPLGDTLKTHIAREIVGTGPTTTIYRLCDKATGEPVDYCPDSTFDDVSEMQLANAELESRGLAWRSECEIAKQHQREQDAERERNRWYITHEERLALAAFYRVHGLTWKAKLRQAWQRGDASPILQYLATHRCFGPDGLARYKTKHLAELAATA